MTNADRTTFAGATVMAACACGTSSGVASVFTSAGIGTSAGITYPVIVGIGVAAFAIGLLQRGRTSEASPAIPLMLAVLAFVVAGALAPPRIMRDGLAFTSANLAGFAFYPLAVALFIWAVTRAYRPETPLAVAALAGVGLAAGCTCCLTPGAARFLVLSAGVEPPWLVSRPVLLIAAVSITAAALARSGHPRAIAWLAAGALVSYPLEALSERLVPSLVVRGANIAFLLRYPLWLVGTGMMIYAAATPLRVRTPAHAEVKVS